MKRNCKRVHNPEVGSSILLPATLQLKSGPKVGQSSQNGGFSFDLLKRFNNQDEMKPYFTFPTLHMANGDLNARWHVEFNCIHPDTGESKRFRVRNSETHPSGINRIKDYATRYAALLEIQQETTKKLQTGWLPFTDSGKQSRDNIITVTLAFTAVSEIKSGYLAVDSYNSLKYRLTIFTNYLASQQKGNLHPSQITTLDILEFLNQLTCSFGKKKKPKVAIKVKPRTRNNYLVDIHGAFEFMRTIDKTWCPVNPCKDVKQIPNRSDRHEIWKPKKLATLSKHLKEKNPNLYLFCLTFMLLGIRPKEAVCIQLEQINLIDRTFLNRASNEKTSSRKIKRIFEALHKELLLINIDEYPPNYYLFTTKGKPGAIPTTRGYFSKQFTKEKNVLGFTSHNTMYALKHTFIVELVKSGESLKNCMKITGHKTLTAFQAYVQQYLDEPAEEIKDDFVIGF